MDTIVALSSGVGRAGVSVVRASGPHVRFVIETMCRRVLTPRRATLTDLLDPVSGQILDRGLAIYFPAPASATGEDVLELHVHGGPALVREVLAAVRALHERIRFAEPGEFTRRALENGKVDLLGVEALGELLAAESFGQLEQARRQMSGELTSLALGWRDTLVEMRALIEAHLDFSDEGDVPTGVDVEARTLCAALRTRMRDVLASAERGRRMRDGVRVAIVGPPNAGKSALFNKLVQRDAAIVSPVAGTTRDVVEATVEIGGWPVVFQDTAGLRESDDPVEIEGVKRALVTGANADLVLVVTAPDVAAASAAPRTFAAPAIEVIMKSDLVEEGEIGALQADALRISAVSGEGLSGLFARIKETLDNRFGSEPALVSRDRHVEALLTAIACLETAEQAGLPELMAEDLRLASRAIGRLVGDVDLDSVLDRLFEGFCIGK